METVLDSEHLSSMTIASLLKVYFMPGMAISTFFFLFNYLMWTTQQAIAGKEPDWVEAK